MRIILAAALLAVACEPKQNTSTSKTETVMNETQTATEFYNFKLNTLTGAPFSFSDLKGKKVLLVNVASECGYTPQYGELQKLHEQYKDKVQVIGIPANNFGGQEPGSNEQIAQFCERNYGVTFPVLEKISVVGEDRHPLYVWLEQQSGEEPNWNFCKYLIDENGKVQAFFPSKTKPMSEELLQAVSK